MNLDVKTQDDATPKRRPKKNRRRGAHWEQGICHATTLQMAQPVTHLFTMEMRRKKTTIFEPRKKKPNNNAHPPSSKRPSFNHGQAKILGDRWKTKGYFPKGFPHVIKMNRGAGCLSLKIDKHLAPRLIFVRWGKPLAK